MSAFDRIDRQFQSKPKLIQLECEACSKTGEEVFRRFSMRIDDDETRVLCERCWTEWR